MVGTICAYGPTFNIFEMLRNLYHGVALNCRCFKIQKSVGRTIDDLKPHKKGDIEKKKEKDIV